MAADFLTVIALAGLGVVWQRAISHAAPSYMNWKKDQGRNLLSISRHRERQYDQKGDFKQTPGTSCKILKRVLTHSAGINKKERSWEGKRSDYQKISPQFSRKREKFPRHNFLPRSLEKFLKSRTFSPPLNFFSLFIDIQLNGVNTRFNILQLFLEFV